MDLTFNVIFMPGMVRYLRLAVLSWLRFSPYRYRLVANGLGADELRALLEFSRSSNRLEFLAYPTVRSLPHGTMLSWLFNREPSEHFCFLDPDVFASSPFHDELERQLSTCDVFSSCSHLCLDPEVRLVGMQGRAHQTPTGLPLAATFFAVYRCSPLRRVTHETGLGFESYAHNHQIPGALREHLVQIGLGDVKFFDTGKLLNVLCHRYQLRFRHAPIPGLKHIGKMCGRFTESSWRSTPWKEWLRNQLGLPYVVRDRDLVMTRRRRARGLHWIQHHKGRIGRFFAYELQHLFDGGPEPVFDVSDRGLTERVSELRTTIRDLYTDHRRMLAA